MCTGGKEECGKSNTVPGLILGGEEPQPNFKSWEQWEKGGRLEDIYHWRVKNQESRKKEVGQKPKKQKHSSNKALAVDNTCKESINQTVRRILLSRFKPKGEKTSSNQNKESKCQPKNSSWKGQREAPSEIPMARKRCGLKASAHGRKGEAEKVVKGILDEVLVKVGPEGSATVEKNGSVREAEAEAVAKSILGELLEQFDSQASKTAKKENSGGEEAQEVVGRILGEILDEVNIVSSNTVQGNRSEGELVVNRILREVLGGIDSDTVEIKRNEEERDTCQMMKNNGWPPNPCPLRGGTPGSGPSQAEGSQRSETSGAVFKYEHPNNSYTLEMNMTDDLEVKCPGCGQMKKQLIRHIKSDKSCQKKCSRIDLASLDKQLRLYRQRRRQAKINKDQRTEDEEGFKEKNRKGQEKHSKKMWNKDEEGFKRKLRDKQEIQRKRNRDEDEEGVKENQRKYQKILRASQKEKNPEKVKEQQNKLKRKERMVDTEDQRARRFQLAIMYGPIFPCVSCERRLFHNNMTTTDGLEEKVENKKEGLFRKCLPRLKQEMMVKIEIQGKKTTEKYYICHACKKHLLNGKMPPMCAENGLKIYPIRDESLKLTEVERNMIALRILFMKMCLLKKSRWLGLNDRIINVPVNDDDVLNTVSILPRTPDQAGLIEVDFKRKLEYKNSHVKGQLIDPEKLYKMLDHLRARGNPHYQFYDDINTFRQRLTEKERVWIAVSVQNDANEEMLDLEDVQEGLVEENDEIVDQEVQEGGEEEDEEDQEDKEEKEYREKDPVKKHQGDGYNKSLMLSDMYPEMFHESGYNAVTVAPGEGKTPKNILYDPDWDIKAFPDLNSSDGKYGLYHKRPVKLNSLHIHEI